MFVSSIVLCLLLAVSRSNGFLPSASTSLRQRPAFLHGTLSMSITSSSGDYHHHDDKHRRMAEFLNLEPLPESEERKRRKETELQAREKFASYGDDLWELREMMSEWSEQLMDAMRYDEKKNKKNNNDDDDVGIHHYQIRKHLREAEQRDPELQYKVQLEEMIKAEQEGRMIDAQKHKEQALHARSCLPQFNLEGLWVGKYGGHGYEMINVTYAGDTLVAFKVTGDKNVPRGEITFQADLSPLRSRKQEPLSPIVLTDKAAKKWGTQRLPRYHGLGQVAEEGFLNHQWMDGQLILIGEDYFSFAWVPIEHQIFFGRPSPELALKMLRDGGGATLKAKTWTSTPSVDDDLSVLKDYASHCLELTAETIDDDLKGDAFGCIWHGMDSEECYFE